MPRLGIRENLAQFSLLPECAKPCPQRAYGWAFAQASFL